MDQVETDLQKMLEFDIQSLDRKDDFGKIGFQDCIPLAKQIQDFYRLLPLSSIAVIPDQFRNLLAQQLQQSLQTFNNVKTLQVK